MSREYTNLEQIRLEKLQRLQQQGINAYPNRVARTHTTVEAIQAFEAGLANTLVVYGDARIRIRHRDVNATCFDDPDAGFETPSIRVKNSDGQARNKYE